MVLCTAMYMYKSRVVNLCGSQPVFIYLEN